jgi:hypothetical protein
MRVVSCCSYNPIWCHSWCRVLPFCPSCLHTFSCFLDTALMSQVSTSHIVWLCFFHPLSSILMHLFQLFIKSVLFMWFPPLFQLHSSELAWSTLTCILAFPYSIIRVSSYLGPLFIYRLQRYSRSQWPRSLRHEMSSPTRTLGSWVRNPLKAWMSVCVCSPFVLSCVGTGLPSGWCPVQGCLPTV